MLTLCMNKSNLAVTQFSNYDFNSFATFAGRTLALKEDGIFILDSGGTDIEDNIPAKVEFPVNDFGSVSQKRVRRIYCEGEFFGKNMLVKTENGEGNPRSFVMSSPTEKEGGIFADISRDGKGRFWKFIVENTSGGDFSIDSLSAVLVVLGRRR